VDGGSQARSPPHHVTRGRPTSRWSVQGAFHHLLESPITQRTFMHHGSTDAGKLVLTNAGSGLTASDPIAGSTHPRSIPWRPRLSVMGPGLMAGWRSLDLFHPGPIQKVARSGREISGLIGTVPEVE
jgi:hypothetical protein